MVTMPDGSTYTYTTITTVTVDNSATVDRMGVTFHMEDKEGNVTELWFTTAAVRSLNRLVDEEADRRERDLLL